MPERELELGLALSGGGFRAAFFHLGVLARLAERGLLRQVEAISTVSGGSIIGALLYIHLKDLLENRPRERVTDDDYVTIVRHMEETFLAGVQKNVRARGYESIPKNWKMRRADYSRSDRMGELYDEVFYRPAWENPIFGEEAAPRTRPDGMIEVRDLRIRATPTPGVAVPILIVNATSLNTGHNWRFFALGMGEDPRDRPEWVAIDKNMRMRWSPWGEIAPHQQTFELGLAVAASACVPGLFHPLAVSDLFRYVVDGDNGPEERGVRVQLVDGGVHDNQGVCGLIDSHCKRMIVSDASGQMGDRDEPSTRIHAAAMRSTNGIYGDRVREEQLSGLLNYRKPAALVHLKKGLPSLAIDPLAAKEARAAAPTSLGAGDYGIDRRVQARLSGVRTDLDAFTEVEACSLALHGYREAEVELEVDGIGGLAPAGEARDWGFLRADRWMASPSAGYLRQLDVAQARFGKPMKLGGGRAKLKAAIAAAWLLALAAIPVLPVVWLITAFGSPLSWRVPFWATFVAVGVAGLAAGFFVWLYLGSFKTGSARARLAEFLYARASAVVVAIPLWASAQVMLFLTPDFVNAGRFDRLD